MPGRRQPVEQRSTSCRAGEESQADGVFLLPSERPRRGGAYLRVRPAEAARERLVAEVVARLGARGEGMLPAGGSL